MSEEQGRSSTEAVGQVTVQTPALTDIPVLAELVENSQVVYYCPPRLTIAHLLTWITLAAVLYTIENVYAMASDASVHYRSWYVTYNNVNNLITNALGSVCLVGAISIACNKLRGAVGRLQPGHWFVIFYAVSKLVYAVTRLLSMNVPQSLSMQTGGEISSFWYFVWAIWELCFSACCLLIVILWRDAWRWRAVIITLIGSSVTYAVMYFGYLATDQVLQAIFYLLTNLLIIVSLIILFIAAEVDLILRCRRGSLHWLGVVSLAFWLGLFLLRQVLVNVIQIPITI